MSTDDELAAIDAALIRIRRRQTARTLGRAAYEAAARAASQTVGRTVDRDRARTISLDQVAATDAVEEGGPDGEVTVGDVAVRLGIDPSRASRVVAGAIESGYLERFASQRDGRRICLRVTPTGRTVVDGAHRARRDMIAGLLTGWTAGERADLARLLTKFTDAL